MAQMDCAFARNALRKGRKMIDISQWDWHEVSVSYGGTVLEAEITHLFDLPDFISEVTIRKYPSNYCIAYSYFGDEMNDPLRGWGHAMIIRLANRIEHTKFETDPQSGLAKAQKRFDILRETERDRYETQHAL